jgi:hypothetical protein
MAATASSCSRPLTNRGGGRRESSSRRAGTGLPRRPDAQSRWPTSRSAAHALAYVIIATAVFTRSLRLGQAVRPLSLTTPPRSSIGSISRLQHVRSGQFTRGAWLEPRATVRRRHLFDLSRWNATRCITRWTDAMAARRRSGAGRVRATVLVGACRNARRRAGVGYTCEQARLANAGLVDHARRGAVVTGRSRGST